jgi:succinate dehydrogenase / fumarate reductase flavoprotein subunit
VFKGQYAESIDEADQWLKDNDSARRTPDLLPRDEVARAINSEVKAGRGSPHGGVFLDVASRLPADTIRKKLPSMYHQFKELAGVDITAEPMEVGPTCHYVMGGVEVIPDTCAAVGVPGLFAAGEVAGGMHGSNRLGGNSLSDLLVFGRRAGAGASADLDELSGTRPALSPPDIDQAAEDALRPFAGDGAENPYTVHTELQMTMNDLVGIIRRSEEMDDALEQLEQFKSRALNVTVEGHRQFNPGWQLALHLANMLAVSECVAKAALMREESRGGHTREDFPIMDPAWRQTNLICRMDGDSVRVDKQPLPVMPDELLGLFDRDELSKYMTEPELSGLPKGDA